MAEPWREEDTWVEAHGRRLRVHSHHVPGPGRPVILLHGLLSSGRQWRGTLRRLQGRADIWAPDMPAFGRSDAVRRPQRLGDHAAVLEAWAAARDLGAAALVGHSFGGMVAVDWAARWPGRVAALGLMAPAVVPHGFPVPWTAGHPLTGRLLLWAVSLRPVGRRFFRQIAEDVDRVSREDQDDFIWSVRHCRSLLGLTRFYEFDDLQAALAAIRVPVRIAWGERDRVLPVSDADVVAAGLARAEVVRWPCGHSLMAERPEACAAFVLDVAAEAARPPAADVAGRCGGGAPPPAPSRQASDASRAAHATPEVPAAAAGQARGEDVPAPAPAGEAHPGGAAHETLAGPAPQPENATEAPGRRREAGEPAAAGPARELARSHRNGALRPGGRAQGRGGADAAGAHRPPRRPAP